MTNEQKEAMDQLLIQNALILAELRLVRDILMEHLKMTDQSNYSFFGLYIATCQSNFESVDHEIREILHDPSAMDWQRAEFEAMMTEAKKWMC